MQFNASQLNVGNVQTALNFCVVGIICTVCPFYCVRLHKNPYIQERGWVVWDFRIIPKHYMVIFLFMLVDCVCIYLFIVLKK